MHLLPNYILLLLLNLSLALSLSLPHPNPDSIADEVQMQLNSSRSRYLLQQEKDQCLTGNPIDDCWHYSGIDWHTDRQHLAGCGIEFGRNALGGRSGQIYLVTDSSNRDPVNPVPGTLRYAAIQDSPLWITFASDMTIRLSEELLVNSFRENNRNSDLLRSFRARDLKRRDGVLGHIGDVKDERVAVFDARLILVAIFSIKSGFLKSLAIIYVFAVIFIVKICI